jgi:GDSL-like Lipase/Acylhydrolase family
MPHVVLAGDSILDNEHYVADDQLDVTGNLAEILPWEYDITLTAVDGATTLTLPLQIPEIPRDATRLIISIGGNDAGRNMDLLRLKQNRFRRGTSFFATAMRVLQHRVGMFEESYRETMDLFRALGVPVTVCTIYDCDFGWRQDTIRPALAAFNDVILRYALQHRLDILDLRHVCTEPEDYELEIEPSAVGGRKIAQAIAGMLIPAEIAA